MLEPMLTGTTLNTAIPGLMIAGVSQAGAKMPPAFPELYDTIVATSFSTPSASTPGR